MKIHPLKTPAISIVMSVFNGQEFLRESIDSILGQTFTDFEFVIIDDGSTDATPEILSHYANFDPRIRIFPQKNLGRAEALNRGISLANAALIGRMDADDIALPERLQEQLNYMNTHPQVGLLGTGIDLVTPEGHKIDTYYPPAGDDEIRALLLSCNPFRHPTTVMRKETISAVGGYRRPLLDADDYDLWLRMAECTKMANIRRPLLRYRLHSNQVTIRNMSHQVLCCWVARTAASLRNQGLSDPLWCIEEITPEFARRIGVKDEAVRRETAAAHLSWIGIFADFRPDWALEMIDRLLEFAETEFADRRVVAAALLKAASINFKRRRLAKALASGGRAISVQPIESVRIAKMALARRIRPFNSGAVSKC